MRSGSKSLMIGPRPFAYACAYVHSVFTTQSYDISIRTSTRRNNLSFFSCAYVLLSTQFSLAYTCACAYGYAYAYTLVKTSLYAATRAMEIALLIGTQATGVL